MSKLGQTKNCATNYGQARNDLSIFCQVKQINAKILLISQIFLKFFFKIAHLPVVAITAYHLVNVEEDARDAYFSKPLETNSIVDHPFHS